VRVLVTGSSGHLGEALVRVLTSQNHEVIGIDVLDSDVTEVVGTITDRPLVADCMRGADAVIHTATLHKPHIGTHTRQQFVDTNVSGTLTLLEEAVSARVGCFVFTSTTSLYGRANVPAPGQPAAWIDEEVVPIPKNIYGATKRSAEDLCELFHADHGLPCLILRTSRFFPEPDDNPEIRGAYADANVKVNELLYRRVDLEDAVSAHLLALRRAETIGFGRFVISATTPFQPEDLAELRTDAPAVVQRWLPQCEAIYDDLGWRLFPSIDRVYVNDRARAELGWAPRHDFGSALERLRANGDPRSSLARTIGAKGYHATASYPYTQR
jgi:UDP-glucose 4-epimerase